MRLFLIRHGQTPHNVTGALDTAFPGAGLTGLGQKQAATLPRALADETISGIYASPLLRTQLTAEPLARTLGLGVDVRNGLEEISAGRLELRSDQQARDHYASCLRAWMLGDLERPMPGGPDGHAFLRRFDGALEAVSQVHGPDDTVVFFTHGAAIRVYTAVRAGIDAQTAVSLQVMNTGGALLTGHARAGWALTQWRTEPFGGDELEGVTANDVTGGEVSAGMRTRR